MRNPTTPLILQKYENDPISENIICHFSYSYFQRCQENVGDSKVLHMADTLYWMSEKKGDQRMQAVALTLKLDHYYFKGDEDDSIIHYTKVVKEFAEKFNQPKYYYFVWNNRLI